MKLPLQILSAMVTDHDIRLLLEHRRQIAVTWCVEDVQSVRPDLTDEQSWAVLQQCRHVHDCDVGFNWLLIETVADDMFPDSNDYSADPEETGA